MLSYDLVYIQFLCTLGFVPLLCNLVFVVKCFAFSLSTSLLCPLLDFYPWCIYLVFMYWLSVGHANDTLHWAYYLAYPNVHSLCEWALWSLFIVIVRVWSSHGLLLNSIFAWSHCAYSICITSFSAYNDHIVLLFFFRRYLYLWFKSYTDSIVRCEWVLFNYS